MVQILDRFLSWDPPAVHRHRRNPVLCVGLRPRREHARGRGAGGNGRGADHRRSRPADRTASDTSDSISNSLFRYPPCLQKQWRRREEMKKLVACISNEMHATSISNIIFYHLSPYQIPSL